MTDRHDRRDELRFARRLGMIMACVSLLFAAGGAAFAWLMPMPTAWRVGLTVVFAAAAAGANIPAWVMRARAGRDGAHTRGRGRR